MSTITLQDVGQNAAAIAHSLFGDTRFERWFTGPNEGSMHATRQDEFGGYAGLYVHIANIAAEMEKAIAAHGGWHEAEIDFYLTVDAVVKAMLDGNTPTRPDQWERCIVRF